MRKYLLIIGFAILITSCKTTAPVLKSVAYKGIYDEKPLSILIMPPINKSINVEAKGYFHSTLSTSLVNAGYYVIPSFLSMEILKRESAYDSENFINAPLNKFGEVFGVDMVLFTTIDKWEKSGLAAQVRVDVEYVLKSTKTNTVLYKRKGQIICDASVATGAGGSFGALADIAASAVNTAATNYATVARQCNYFTFKDLPYGKYSPKYGLDEKELAGKEVFKAQIKAQN